MRNDYDDEGQELREFSSQKSFRFLEKIICLPSENCRGDPVSLFVCVGWRIFRSDK